MNKDMKVGIGIITTITVLLLLIFGWRLVFREPSYLLNIKFNDIGTLQEGDAVIIQGVKTGKVKNIFLQNADIVVGIQFPKSILIPKESNFQISNIGIMGEKAIQINRSTKNIYYQANDTIQGQIQQSLSISEGIGKLASSFSESLTISQKLDSIIILLNKQTELLEKFK
jgi:ABC-type transporter Mla subunit MlaD